MPTYASVKAAKDIVRELDSRAENAREAAEQSIADVKTLTAAAKAARVVAEEEEEAYRSVEGHLEAE